MQILITSKHNETAAKLEDLQKVLEQRKEVDIPTSRVPASVVTDFEKLVAAYEKACSEGTLTEEKAKELKDKMEAVLAEEIELSEQYENSNDALKDKIDKNKESIRIKQAKIAGLSTDCTPQKSSVVIEAPTFWNAYESLCDRSRNSYSSHAL